MCGGFRLLLIVTALSMLPQRYSCPMSSSEGDEDASDYDDGSEASAAPRRSGAWQPQSGGSREEVWVWLLLARLSLFRPSISHPLAIDRSPRSPHICVLTHMFARTQLHTHVHFAHTHLTYTSAHTCSHTRVRTCMCTHAYPHTHVRDRLFARAGLVHI